MMYGSLINRIEENREFCDEIKVGTGMTEYLWSDREAYEVTEVKDQNHVTVRVYDHKHIGEPFTNEWELISNPDNPEYTLEKRGGKWYWTTTITREDIERIPDNEEGTMQKFHIACAGFDIDKILERGKQTKRRKANVSFGKADYHYDYEF